MKSKKLLLSVGAFLALSLATTVLAEPLAVLTIRSYADLQQSITRLVKTVNPDAPFDFDKEVGRGLGLTEETVLDRKKPWQVAVWFDGKPNQLIVAAKVPTKDVQKLKASLNPQGMMMRMGRDWVQGEDGFGVVTIMKPETLTQEQQTSFKQWMGGGVKRSAGVLELSARPTDSLRQQALGMLAFGKMFMTQNLTNNQAFTGAGMNIKAMSDLFGLYFEVIETVVTGMDKLRLDLDLSADALIVDKSIVPKPDSVLAGWFEQRGHALSAGQKNIVDPKATMSFLGQFGKDPSKMALLNKFMLLGLQMQNVPADDPSVKALEKIFNSVFPMTYAFSMYSEDAMTFKGSYAFPESDAGQVYAEIKEFFRTGMQGMVGKDKMYASAELKEKHHVLDGIAIDRFSIAINTNSPMFQMPGQAEQIQAMWPDGKMDFDYALKGKELLFASPGLMKDLVAGKTVPGLKPSGDPVGESTALAGHMNMINLMKFSVASNPMLPNMIKKQFAQLNPEGAALQFRINVDKQLNAKIQLPLKLLEEFRKMGPPQPQPQK